MSELSIDFETRSTIELKKTGVYKYAQHPSTDIWCMAWAFDDEEPEIWTPDMAEWDGDNVYHGLPARVVEHIRNGDMIRAWNAQFERVIWNEIMVRRYNAPEVAPEQWVCTQAEALAMALPRSLAHAAEVLGVQEQKDSQGWNLMMRMTRPRKILEDGTVVWWDDPERLEKLYDYCKQDVRTERSVAKALRRLTATEREIYLLDQRMNDRGIRIDLDLVRAARRIADIGVERANLAILELTVGAVGEVTNHGRLRQWLNEQGIETNSVSKAAVRELLDQDLPPVVRAVLEHRADAGRTSLAKLDAMEACACDDGRARGLLQYHGASTGRWAGQLAQPQNFARPEYDGDPEIFIPLVLAEDYDALELFRHPVATVVDLLRSCLTAEPGNELIAADYSAIEARVLNWLADQRDMVELFRQYDAAPKKEKPNYDPYRRNAARLYKIPLDQVQKFPHRQTGKFQELGCGYGMGAKKAVSAAKDTYGLTLTHDEAKEIVDNYRETHPMVVSFWHAADAAAIEAVQNPGIPVTFGGLGNLKFVKAGAYLYLILPSGRPLAYAAPRVVEAQTPWGEVKPQVEISAVNSLTKKWGRQRMYGGLWVENIVQAASRDLLAEGMLRAEKAGYIPILSVHDEVVAEVPEGFGSVTDFEKLLTTLPGWAEGCPVAAEGWRGFRYRK